MREIFTYKLIAINQQTTDLHDRTDRELRYATPTIRPIGPGCRAQALTPWIGYAHAPPIHGVRADCDSRPGAKISKPFFPQACESRGSTAGAVMCLTKYEC